MLQDLRASDLVFTAQLLFLAITADDESFCQYETPVIEYSTASLAIAFTVEIADPLVKSLEMDLDDGVTLKTEKNHSELSNCK